MTMANPNLIVSWTADKAPEDPFSDEIEARRIQWRKNQAGIEVLKSWLSLGNGTLVDICGTDGVLELVPSGLDELKPVVDQYIQTTGFTLSVGVGGDMADAERARIVAKHRGGDRMILWSDELYPELAAAQERQNDAEYDEYGDSLNRNEKLSDIWTDEDFVELAKMTRQPYEEFMKSDFSQDEMNALESPETPMSGGASAPAYARAGSPPEQATSGASPGGGDVPPDAQTASQAPEQNIQGQATAGDAATHEDAFHGHAQAADADDQASQSPQRQQIKQAVVQVLKQVAPQLKQLDAIKEQVPDAYQGVLAVVEAMAAMAQALNGEEPAVPKEEEESGESGQESGQNGPKEEKTEKSEDKLEKMAAKKKPYSITEHSPADEDVDYDQYGDLFYGMAPQPEENWVEYQAHAGGQRIGSALMTHEGGYLSPIGVYVHPDHRRHGVASALYAQAESDHGVPVKPSEVQTPDSKALWTQPKRPFGNDLQKDAVIPAKHAGIHHHLNLPVGTENNGEIKVVHPETGKTSWKSVRAGIVQSPDGHATSSRNPNGK